MKLKILFILVFSLFFIIFINTQETIIDSIYSSPQLDGTIFFRESTQQFEIYLLGGYMFIGDTGMGINPDPNSRERGYISFELPEIPEGYSVDSVFVRMHQNMSYGNNEPGVFPIWNVAGGDTMFCIMDHIDYDNSLDPGDWTAGDPGDTGTLNTNIGIISDNPENGFRFMNITEYVIADYDNGRDKTQYRIRFPIETDWDYWNDKIMFGQGAGLYSSPIIFLYFNKNNEIDSNELGIVPHFLKVYPNPFNPETKIQYELFHNSDILVQFFNVKGQLIETLVNEFKHSGKHSVIWNAKNQSTGIYFYRITIGAQTQTGKCLLLK